MIRILCILIFGVIYLIIAGGTLQPISLSTSLILIAGVILGPIFIYVFFYSALEKTNLASASALKSINPIFTFVLAFLFLGEIITFQQLISFVIIIIGTYLILKKQKTKTSLKKI